MSRVGRKPIKLPAAVKVRVEGDTAVVEGPRGRLVLTLPGGVRLRVEGDVVHVVAPVALRGNRGYQGLVRARLKRMVDGVVKAFERTLEIHGVGYKAELQGERLRVQVGHSHPVFVDVLPGLKVVVDKPQTRVTVIGSDLELVGQLAATIRHVREPEPYKGKGIRYAGETVRRLAGKAGKPGGK